MAHKIPGTVYPAGRDYLKHNALFLVRGPAIATALTLLVEPIYRAFAAVVPRDDWRIVGGASIVHSVVGLSMLAFFMSCETWGWLQQYRLPRTKRMIPSPMMDRHALQDIFANVFLQVPMLYAGLLLVPAPGYVDGEAPLPSVSWIFAKFSMAILVNEIALYVFHRWEHHVPWAYINLHKKHHLYVGTTALGTEYTTFPEKLLTVGAMRYFQDAHILLYLVWIAWRMWEATEIHSGYCFEGTLLSQLGLLCSEASLFHNDHHAVNSGNYGTHWLRLDGIFGTCDVFFRDHAGKYPTLPKINQKV